MKNARRSFTLLELLIAASIFSVVLISIYSAFQTGILTYRKVDAAFEVYQAARIALNRIELDLRNSFAYKAGDFQFEGREKSLEFFSLIDLYQGAKLNTSVCRLRYVWDEDSKTLKRTCRTGIDALKADIQQEGEDFADNAAQLSFEYAFPTGEKENPYKWQQSWLKDNGPGNNLPLAVKIRLSLQEKGGRPENRVEFIKIVPLPLSEQPT